MNRVFKTKWSAAHQQYVVTDEHRATKGKASKPKNKENLTRSVKQSSKC